MVIDLKTTDPLGWEKDKSPLFKNKTDAILYELQIRDASISDNSGIKNKGKYLGLTETGTKNRGGPFNRN
jgi:pullulanase